MHSVVKEEKIVGLETFYTSHEGIGGKLRSIPEDFKVTEHFSPPLKNDDGIYTIARIRSKNWETNHLIRTLSHKLHISRKRVGFAGTKDKRSLSTQLFSFYDVPIEDVEDIRIKDVIIDQIYRSDQKLFLGSLKGNHFDIKIREISGGITKNQLDDLLEPLCAIHGFPNFFGIQRFGVIRPITHIVGKQMVNGDIKSAVETYLTHIDLHEEDHIISLRKQLKETNDYSYAFQHFPPPLSFEKALLNHLQVHPTDFIGAIKQLPKNLISLFINAYQSYLFNRMLSQRIKRNLPLDQAIEGDVIIEVQNGQVTDRYYPVTDGNIEKVNTQITRKKAVVSTVLIGYDTIFSRGEMGEIEHEVFDAEFIDKRDFIIPDLPVASSAGARRSIFAPLNNLSYDLIDDEHLKDQKLVPIQFNLKKGCYATSFLRELMKADDIRAY